MSSARSARSPHLTHRLHAATVGGALLFLAIGLAYSGSLSAPFHFDDYGAIVDNPQIRSLWPFTQRGPSVPLVAGRPILALSYALNYGFSGLTPTGYRIVNVLIHVICTLLVYRLTFLTFQTRRVAARLREHANGLALSVALIWALHPLQVGTITYISARSEALMALWYLLTLYSAIRANNQAHRRTWSTVAVIACALGMATKEVMITAPLAVVLYDRSFLFESFKEGLARRGLLYLSLVATSGILIALAWSAPHAESAGFSVGVSPWTYLLNQAVIVTDYFRRIVWPHPLVFTYGEPQPLTLTNVLPQALFVMTAVVLVLWTWKRHPTLGFVGLWFFMILAPTSSLLPIATEVGAERRLYLPLITVVAGLVVFADHLFARYPGGPEIGHGNRMRVALVSVLAMTLLAVTVARNAQFLSSEVLWRSTLAAWPSALAHRNLATALVLAGKREEAIEHMREAATQHPEVRLMLGQSLVDLGHFEPAIQELRAFLATADLRSNAARDARFALGRAYMGLKQPQQAATEFGAIVRARTGDAQAKIGLADSLLSAGEFHAAEQVYRDYLRQRPDEPGALVNLGIALTSQDALKEAEDVFRHVIDVDPRNSSAHRNLAVTLASRGDVAEASAHAASAAALAPHQASTHELYGRILLAQGRWAEARQELQRAVELDPSAADAREALERSTALERQRNALGKSGQQSVTIPVR